MVLPPVVVVAVFIGFPVGAAIAYTLGRAGGPNSVVALLAQRQHIVHHGVTTAAYREVLSNPHVLRDLWATVWVTLVTIVLVLLISWSIALYLRLSDSRLSRIVSALSVIPLFIPVVIASYAILIFYASDGFLKTLAYHVGWDGFPDDRVLAQCRRDRRGVGERALRRADDELGAQLGAERVDRGRARRGRLAASYRPLGAPADERDPER